MSSNVADKLDYLVAIASGIICGMLDVFWVGEFSISCVEFLEKGFPISADGNTSDFGEATEKLKILENL